MIHFDKQGGAFGFLGSKFVGNLILFDSGRDRRCRKVGRDDGEV